MRENVKTIRFRASQEINFTHDLRYMLDFTIHLATTKGMLRRYLRLSVAEANDALRWFIENAPRLEDSSPHRIEMIANQRKNNQDGWLAACKNWIVPDNQIPAEQKSLRLPPVPVFRVTTTRGFPERQARWNAMSTEEKKEFLDRKVGRVVPVADSAEPCGS